MVGTHHLFGLEDLKTLRKRLNFPVSLMYVPQEELRISEDRFYPQIIIPSSLRYPLARALNTQQE